jgi:hypothetical protein
MNSLKNLTDFFSNVPTEKKAPPLEYMEDLLSGSEVKDLDDESFLECVEPTTTERTELIEHIVPIYPYNE